MLASRWVVLADNKDQSILIPSKLHGAMTANPNQASVTWKRELHNSKLATIF